MIEPSGHLRHGQGELVLLHVDVKNRHLHGCKDSVLKQFYSFIDFKILMP